MGFVGRLVGQFVLVPYISRRLRRRLVVLKRVAEHRAEWEKYLPNAQEAV
jgi:hypothetical protein